MDGELGRDESLRLSDFSCSGQCWILHMLGAAHLADFVPWIVTFRSEFLRRTHSLGLLHIRFIRKCLVEALSPLLQTHGRLGYQ